jgi:predicted RNA methylase
MMGIRIGQDVLEVLDGASVDGNRLVLQGALDRKLYTDVNKVLESIGGKWNRGAKAHLFDVPVADVLDPIMETGEYSRTKQDFGQFDSPKDVVDRVVHIANIEAGMMVLEPSAGLGNLADGAARCGALVTCWELDAKRADVLRAKFRAVNNGDFLSAGNYERIQFDRVVMNPPFARQADIAHVLHAVKFLKPGGRLVSVMSAGVLFRTNRAAADFRQFVADRSGEFERLPDASFELAGTRVQTCIVSFNA